MNQQILNQIGLDPMIIFFSTTCLTGVVVSAIAGVAVNVRRLRRKAPEESSGRDETTQQLDPPNEAMAIFQKDRNGEPLNNSERRFLNTYQSVYYPTSQINEQLPRARGTREVPTHFSGKSHQINVVTDPVTIAALSDAPIIERKRSKRTRRGRRGRGSKESRRQLAKFREKQAKQAEFFGVSLGEIQTDQGYHQGALIKESDFFGQTPDLVNAFSQEEPEYIRIRTNEEDDELEDRPIYRYVRK